MGKKIASTYFGLCVLTVVLQTISCSITWHSTLFLFGIVPAFRMQTGLLHVKIDVGASKLCKLLSSKEYCEELEDGVSLQAAAHTWCAPLIQSTFPSPCHAFTTAFYAGLFLFTLYIINLIVLAISCWLVHHYMDSAKHKASYRHAACVMHCVSTILLVIGVISFTCLATQQLDTIGGNGMSMIFGPSQGPGVGYGVWGFCFSVVLQIIAAGLFALLPLNNEWSEDDAEAEKINKEAAMFAAVYGSAGQDGKGQQAVNRISQQQHSQQQWQDQQMPEQHMQQQMQQQWLQPAMQQHSAFQGGSSGFADTASFGLPAPSSFVGPDAHYGSANAYSAVIQVQATNSPVVQVQPPLGSPQSPAW